MKIYRVVLTIIDFDDVGEKCADLIEGARYPNDCIKPTDYLGAFGCSRCHAIVDSTHDEVIRLAHAEGVLRTQIHFVAIGILKF